MPRQPPTVPRLHRGCLTQVDLDVAEAPPGAVGALKGEPPSDLEGRLCPAFGEDDTLLGRS